MRSTAPRSRTTVVSSPACAFSKVPRKVEDLRYVLGHALGYGLIWPRLSGIGPYTSSPLFRTKSEVPLRGGMLPDPALDRKSTRLNSSHRCISYAVFCLKKKKKIKNNQFNNTILHK